MGKKIPLQSLPIVNMTRRSRSPDTDDKKREVHPLAFVGLKQISVKIDDALADVDWCNIVSFAE
jgi:hypothetical protein